MDITLHIGAHRTAVTSLHRVLGDLAPVLAQHGVAAWGRQDTRAGLFDGLHCPVDRLTPEVIARGDRSVEVVRALLEVLEDDGVARLIVSEQRMIGAAPDMLAAGRLYPFLSERLGRFVPAFHERCDRVVLTIRSYDAFWASLMAARVARGGALPGQRLRTRLAEQRMRWRRIVEEVATTLPRAHLVVLAHEGTGGAWPTVLQALGAPPAAVQAARGADAGRDRLARGPGARKMRTMLARRGDDGLPLRTDAQGRWQPFAEAEVAAMRRAYDDDLAWLRNGAAGLATFIESADADDPRKMDRNRGRNPDDPRQPQEDAERLGRTG